MAINVSANSSPDVELIPAGMHNAVCIALYDIGSIHSEKFNKTSRKVIFMWEFPEEPFIEWERDGQMQKMPRCLPDNYTLSLHKKAGLRNMLESWRGRPFSEQQLGGFDLETVLGVQAYVQIMHSSPEKHGDRIYANVNAVLPPPKGIPKVRAHSALARFSVMDLKQAVMPATLPEWIQEKVATSEEWRALVKKPQQPAGRTQQQTSSPTDDPGQSDLTNDDVPF